MHRALIVASFSLLALASTGRTVPAQAPATRDSVAHSAAETAPVIDTASRKLPLNARDHLLDNCAARSQNPVGFALPLLCARRVVGELDRFDRDSVSILQNGQLIRLALGDARAIDRLNRATRARAVTGALLGGGVAFASTMVFGASSSSGNGRSLGTALVVGGMGALVGGFTASRYGGDWPRVLQDAQH